METEGCPLAPGRGSVGSEPGMPESEPCAGKGKREKEKEASELGMPERRPLSTRTGSACCAGVVQGYIVSQTAAAIGSRQSNLGMVNSPSRPEGSLTQFNLIRCRPSALSSETTAQPARDGRPHAR